MREYTVGDCFYQIRNGASIRQGDAAGGYPITRIETTTNDTFNRDRMGYAGITDLSKYESYVLEDGDLLMSHINSVQYLGRTVLYEKQEDETIIHGMNLLSLKADRDIILPKFAYYSFRSGPFKKQLSKITKKSVNQASFTVADLKKITLSVPPLSEQEEIVQTLDKCRSIEAMRKQQLSALDDLIKARFVEMFGDLEINPYGWPVKTIGEISHYLRSGLSRKLSDEDIGLPVIRSGNIQNGRFIYDDIKYWHINDSQGANTAEYVLSDGDILISFINSIAQIGKVAVFKDVGRDCIYTTNLFRMKLAENCNEYYFNWYAMTEYYYRQLKNIIQPAVNQASFTTVNYLKLKIPLPPLEIQVLFYRFVEQIDKSKDAVKNTLAETQLLFDSLMQQYFG